MYIVIKGYRHEYIDLHLYKSRDEAISKANSIAEDECMHSDPIESVEVDDCILCLIYSLEGDRVSVREIEVLDKGE